MRTLDINEFRRQSYGRAMARVLAECNRFGVANLWDTDLRNTPGVRAGALSGRTEMLACYFEQARHHAVLAGFHDAANLLATRQCELRLLGIEVSRCTAKVVTNDTVDVVVLDADWGKKGRGARIISIIKAERLTAVQVSARFQLALSTAKNYIRRANK